jgi:NADH-quinone oxidoreductase subunit B
VTATGVLRPTRHLVDAGRRYAVWVFDVGLACCAVEFLAATSGVGGRDAEVGRLGAVPTALEPADADVLLVSGTLTARLTPAVRALYDRLPAGAKVVAFGACASSGGPYWDSYCVTPGAAEIVPVDVYVPGCPPRPEALLEALRSLAPR